MSNKNIKFATTQAFNGRRVSLGMVVHTVTYDNEGELRARPAECVEFSEDEPLFRIAETPGYPVKLEFVAGNLMLDVGKCCWPERV